MADRSSGPVSILLTDHSFWSIFFRTPNLPRQSNGAGEVRAGLVNEALELFLLGGWVLLFVLSGFTSVMHRRRKDSVFWRAQAPCTPVSGALTYFPPAAVLRRVLAEENRQFFVILFAPFCTKFCVCYHRISYDCRTVCVFIPLGSAPVQKKNLVPGNKRR
ncbi:unnamed protein product, partial [Discosporangium mesarthrocarpum]